MYTKRKLGPIARWLHDHGKTQEWLADQLHIAKPTASKLCTGRQMPRPAMALQIHKLTGISLEAMARWHASYRPRDLRALRQRHLARLAKRAAVITNKLNEGQA